MPEAHLELLLSRRVVDCDGKAAGRIEEVRAELEGGDWVVTEYLLGPAALLERLSAWSVGLALVRLLGAKSLAAGRRVPWDRMDLSNPQRPRLRCRASELPPL